MVRLPNLLFPRGVVAQRVNMSETSLSSWIPAEVRWLSQQIRPLLHWHLASFLCISTGSLLALLTPLVLRWLIDQVLPWRQTELLVLAVVLVFVGYQGRMALTSVGNYLMLSAAQRMALALRIGLLHHLNTLSADYYDKTPVGTLIYPFNEPVDEISYFGSDLLPAILRMLLTTGLTLGAMVILSPALTLAVLPLVPVFLVTRQHFRRRLAIDSDGVQAHRIQWSAFLEEHLSFVIPIQLLRQERRQERRAFRLLAGMVLSQQILFKTGTWFTVWTSLAIVLAMSLVIGYGGWSVLRGTLTIGSLVAFYSFVAQLFEPLSGAAELYSRSQKTFASVRQVQAVLAQCSTVKDSSSPVYFPQDRPAHVEFAAVGFGYQRQKKTLSIPSLDIRAGEQVAIAGENGAGKSTLAKLIARIYDADCGQVRIGGEDVRRIRLDSLRRSICYIPREPVLFDGTLATNLRFVRPAVSDEELKEVIHCTGLSTFVETLPDGLHQRIGPGGCQLSDGQRQRLAVARALLQRPQVLVLDEATSCLDPASEILVLRNIANHLGTLTLIVITHRLSTASTFSRVLVLSGGRIVEDGNPSTSGSTHSAFQSLFANRTTIAVRNSATTPV